MSSREPGTPLSERELEVLRETAKGQGDVAAAHNLGMAYNTFRNHLTHAFAKLAVVGRTEAFVKLGWLAVPSLEAGDELLLIADEIDSPEGVADPTPYSWARRIREARARIGSPELAGHRTYEPHDCFNMNCRALATRAAAPATRAELRQAISNAYYGARNAGETMEYAAERAVDSVLLSVEALVEERYQARAAAQERGYVERCPSCGRSDEHAAPCKSFARLPGHALAEFYNEHPEDRPDAAQERGLDVWMAEVVAAWRESWEGKDHRYGHDFAAFLGERLMTDHELRDREPYPFGHARAALQERSA